MMPPPPPVPAPRAIERITKNHTPMMSTHGRKFTSRRVQSLAVFSYSTGTAAPDRSSASFRSSRNESTEPIVKSSCAPCAGSRWNRLSTVSLR